MKEFHVRLTPISLSQQSRTRAPIEGVTYFMPTPGLGFTVAGDPLNPEMDLRLVNTSPVKSMEIKSLLPKVIEFETDSGSKYKLEVLE
jgi:hypothetical protein